MRRAVLAYAIILSSLVPPLFAQQGAAPTLQQARMLIGQKKYDQAEEILREMTESNPKSPAAWYLLGYALHAQRKLDAALEAHLKAATFPQTRVNALYNAACAYSLKGDVDAAIETLQKAVAAGFVGRDLLATDADLAAARKDPRFAEVLPPLLDGDALFVEPARVLHTFAGEARNDQFGWVARTLGDVNGDGAIDFVAAAPTHRNSAGKVYVYSSRDGKLLFTRTGKPGQLLGNGAAGAGDVNGDGTPDVIVGAPGSGPNRALGRAYVFSGVDGANLLELTSGKTADGFGYKVCGLGDVDADGHADVAVTAWREAGGKGRCYGYSGRTGEVLFTVDGEKAGDLFGSAVGASRNAKHPLLAVGAQDAAAAKRGRVYVYRLSAAGADEHFVIDGDAASVNLGQMFVSFPGDFNGDGVPDVYASDFADNTAAPGAGRVRVHSGADGRELLSITGTTPGEGFGTSPSEAGDVNGDGVPDLVVGAWQNREQAPSAGKVYLYSGVDGSLLATWTCRQSGDTFGFDATGLGDVDGDGTVDLLLTSAWSSGSGPKTGRVFVLAGWNVPAE
jgi:hypothetical protein